MPLTNQIIRSEVGRESPDRSALLTLLSHWPSAFAMMACSSQTIRAFRFLCTAACLPGRESLRSRNAHRRAETHGWGRFGATLCMTSCTTILKPMK